MNQKKLPKALVATVIFIFLGFIAYHLISKKLIPLIIFNKNTILQSTSFTNSKGQIKELIFVDSGLRNDSNYIIADTYITDASFSKLFAIKISGLNDDVSGFGYMLQSHESPIEVTISPGPSKKFIIISYHIGDGTPMFLINEGGKLISSTLDDNVYQAMKDLNEGMYGYNFDNWKGQDQFYITVGTSLEHTYKLLIDAKTGKTIGLYLMNQKT